MTVAHCHCHSSYFHHAISNAGHNICSLLVTASTGSLALVFRHRLGASESLQGRRVRPRKEQPSVNLETECIGAEFAVGFVREC